MHASKEQILNNNIDQSNNATINSHTLYIYAETNSVHCASQDPRNIFPMKMCASAAHSIDFFPTSITDIFCFFHFQFSVFVRLWIFTIKHSHFTCENVHTHTPDNMRCATDARSRSYVHFIDARLSVDRHVFSMCLHLNNVIQHSILFHVRRHIKM